MKMRDQIRNPELSLPFTKLRARLWTEWHTKDSDRPDTLYHYTDAGGLIGIIDSKTLWATDARYLNDTLEVEYARRLVRDVLEDKRDSQPSEVVREFLESAIETFNPYEALYCVFVACFCEEGDLLSQWRAYADRGAGYSIGFNSGALFNHPKSVSENRMLRKVEYDEDEQVRLLRELVEAICGTLDAETSGMGLIQANGFIYDACRLLRELLTEYLACFKHPGFKEEQEWRIVHPFDTYEDTNNHIEFRTARGAIAPYVKLDCAFGGPPFLGKLPIVSVMHGPAQHPDEAKEALRILLVKHGYRLEDVRVEGSNVPLRG
jgi:Protein of unknown function (DUF2971)